MSKKEKERNEVVGAAETKEEGKDLAAEKVKNEESETRETYETPDASPAPEMSEKSETSEESETSDTSEKSETPSAAKGGRNAAMPEEIHCRRCGTKMEKGVCPNCGYKVYVPMDEKKAMKIRLILGGVLLVGFIIWIIVTQVKG